MKRKWIWTAALLAAVIILVAVAYALRGLLVTPSIEALIRETARAQLGLEVSIGHIGGSLLADIEIRDLQTKAASSDGPVSFLEIKRLSLHYSLLALVDGLPAFLRAAGLQADGLRVRLDLERGGESEPTESASFQLPPALPAIDMRGADIHIRSGDSVLDFNNVSLVTGDDSPEGRSVRIQVSEFSWLHPGVRSGSASVVADLRYSPETVRVDALLLNGQPLVEEANIDFAEGARRLTFAARLRVGGGRVAVVGESTDSALRLEVKGQDVPLAPVADFFELPGRGVLNLDAALSLPTAGLERLDGHVGLSIHAAEFQDIRNAELRLDAQVKDGRLRVDALELRAIGSRAGLTGSDASWADLLAGRFERLLAEISGDFNLESEDVPALLSIAGVAATPAARVPAHRLALAGHASGGRLFVPAVELTTGAGVIRLRNLETSLPPAGEDTPLKADLHLQVPDLGAVASILGIPPLSGSLEGKGSVGGSIGRLKGEVALKGSGLALEGLPLGGGSLRAAVERHTVRIESLSLRNGRDRLEAKGSFDFGRRCFSAVRVEMAAEDISGYIRALAPDLGWAGGGVSGRLEGAGSIEEPDFSLELRVGRLSAGGMDFERVYLRASGAGHRLRVESGQAQTALGRIRLAGEADRRAGQGDVDAVLQELSFKADDVAFGLETPARLRYAESGAITISGFAAGGPQGRISVQGILSFEGRSDLRVQLTGLNGGSWLPRLTGVPLALEGLNADLHAAGTAAAPALRVAGTVKTLGMRNTAPSYGGRFDMGYSDGRLRIEALDLSGPGGHHIALTGALPLDPTGARVIASGPLTLTGRARVPDVKLLRALWPSWPIASGSLEVDLSLRGSWPAPDGELRLTGRRLQPSENAAFPPGPYEAVCTADFREGRLTLQLLNFQGPVARLAAQGDVTGIPSLPEILSGAAPPGRGQVSLNGQLTIEDLGWLSRGLEGVHRVSGRFEARATLAGPLHDPTLEADLHLLEGVLRPEADISPFQALSLRARLAGRNLEIESFKGEMGGAPFEISGRLERIFTLLESGRADLRLNGENLLFYRSDDLRLRADAKLTLIGPIARMTLSGGVVITDGFFGKNFGLLEGLQAGGAKTVKGRGIELFSIEAAPFSDTVFDVRITAAAPFQIKNNLARAAVRPDLRLSGTGRTPALTGRIYLEPSTLYLPAGRMQLQSGLVRFEATDPGRPRLDLVATTRMLGYDITAVAEGHYDEPTVTFSSVPPLPDQELLLLVLTGQAPKAAGARTSEGGRSLNVAVFFGRDMITRIEGDDSTETLQSIVERFDVEVGRFVTRAGDETINAEFRLADGVLREGDTLYLTGEKDIFDYYNAGIKIVFRFR